MIRISTIEELNRQKYGLALYCMVCGRWGEADLDGLAKSGQGSRSVIDARFRCLDCGGLVEKQLRPPVPKLGGTLGYI